MEKEEGERQGKLLQELKGEMWVLEDELKKVGQALQHRAQLKHLAAAASKDGGPVLQTYTVPLDEVRADLGAWHEALLSEYESLTKVTQDIEPINIGELTGNTSVEFALGKLVARIKAPDGRKKARFVCCGNRVPNRPG
eukprot:s444_g46.t1